MSGRITNERLAEIRLAFQLNADNRVQLDTADALLELERSRALIAQLQALSEQMRIFDASDDAFGHDSHNATYHWMHQINALLSAHGTQETGSESFAEAYHRANRGLP